MVSLDDLFRFCFYFYFCRHFFLVSLFYIVVFVMFVVVVILLFFFIFVGTLIVHLTLILIRIFVSITHTQNVFALCIVCNILVHISVFTYSFYIFFKVKRK